MKLNGKRILVTGSSGFVGKNLVEKLKRCFRNGVTTIYIATGYI